MSSKVKVYDPWNENKPRCEVNGKALDYEAINCLVTESGAEFHVKLKALPDIDLNGPVKLEYAPRTLKEAAVVIRSTLAQEEYFDTLVVSIADVLVKQGVAINPFGIAEAVAKRILGIDQNL